MPAGYSGTPLPRKLGIREGYRVGTIDAPADFERTLGTLPASATIGTVRELAATNVTLAFFHASDGVATLVGKLASRLAPEASLWLCWPKRTSALFCGVTGDTVRAAGLAAGLVDIKVAAIDADWSGLKFVVPLANRPRAARKK